MRFFQYYVNASLKNDCIDDPRPFEIPAILNSMHPLILPCESRMFLRFHGKYQQCSTLYLDFQYLGHMNYFKCSEQEKKKQDFCTANGKSQQHPNYGKKKQPNIILKIIILK